MTDFAQGLIGVELDRRYRLDAVLGEGGMGAVFRATQLANDRKVAVKLLKPHLTSDEAALQRFAREARSTQKVDSPHAVKILDFGVTPHRDYYMVLEYLDGRTVQRELEVDGAFAPARVVHIARHALAALGVAHTSGLVHRDVKPDNLLLMRVGGDPDYTKVLDFGVAKLMQGAASEQLALTAAGMVFGTPEFMSPEQACGQPLDGRSDLYSLAATMFTMLTGQGLFESKSAIEWLTHHARTPPPRLGIVKPELIAYPELDALLQRCLAKSRDHRPASAAQLASQLEALAPTLQRPPGIAPSTSSVTSPLSLAPTPAAMPPVRLPGSASSGKTMFHSSSYVRALEGVDLTTLGTANTEASDTLTASTAALRTPRAASRKGLYLGLGGIAIAAAVAGAFGLLAHRGDGAQVAAAETKPQVAAPAPLAPAPAPPAPLAPDVPPVPTPAVPASKPVVSASEPASESQPRKLDAPVRKPSPPRVQPAVAPPPVASSEAATHVHNAEDAQRANKPLLQLTEANLALAADPHNTRAQFLAGDALIRSGDLDHGCAYLRPIKRISTVRDRAHEAGCPDD